MAVTTDRVSSPLGSSHAPSFGQIAALVRAQSLSLFHYYSRGSKMGSIIAGIMSVLWYGMISLGAVSVALLCARAGNVAELRPILAAGALFVVVYWQFVPLLLVSSGAGLDLRRLVIYPLSRAQLFFLDLILRLTSGVEALLVVVGAAAGLAANPRLAWWAPLSLVPFVLFNLALASGLRGVFGRWMMSRRTRELAMFGLVALATVPQILLMSERLRNRINWEGGWSGMPLAPWTLVADWATGFSNGGAVRALSALAATTAWLVAAFAFAWWQMGRTLRFDGAESGGAVAPAVSANWWTTQWPAGLLALLGDPMAALVEKEIRTLARSPRFRVVFIMGFSFSLLIWLPMMAGSKSGPPAVFLTLMIGYALLLLGEACFWNTLGFDRAASQFYFLTPLPFASVLKAKNLTAVIAVTMELLAITAVALILRMPVTAARFAEAAGATAVTTLILLAAGNLGSVYSPRAVDPSDVWRKASAGRTQALVLFASPLLAAPVGLAYLARYAFDNEWAFWGTMAVMAVIAGIAYSVALASAAETAMARRESITGVLSAGSGPVAG